MVILKLRYCTVATGDSLGLIEDLAKVYKQG